MNRSTAKISVTAKQRSLRQLLVLGLMMLAFLTQSYITQTHIHAGPDIVHAVLTKADIAKAGAPVALRHDHGNLPANDDPANCPFCQELIHSGAYVAPVALIVFLTALLVLRFEPVLNLQNPFDSVSHSWRGRGPPHF